MKTRKISIFIILTAFLASCSMVGKHDFASRKYTHNKAGYAGLSTAKVEKVETKQTAEKSVFVEETQVVKNEVAEKAMTESVSTAEEAVQEKVVEKINERSVVSQQKKEVSKEQQFSAPMKMSKSKAKLLQKVSKLDNTEKLLMIIIAIILPPLAVFLSKGLGTEFWIDVILTILGWFPGVLYALWLIL